MTTKRSDLKPSAARPAAAKKAAPARAGSTRPSAKKAAAKPAKASAKKSAPARPAVHAAKKRGDFPTRGRMDEVLKASGARSRALTPPAAGAANTDRARFEAFLRGFTFEWECVYDSRHNVIAENDPDDPGGVTKYGIDRSGHPNLSVDFIRNMTQAQAEDIYYQGEWQNAHGVELPTPLGEIAFDMTTLDGSKRALIALQGAVGLVGSAVDGVWGPTTRAAVQQAAANASSLQSSADRMLDWRAARYYELVHNHPNLAKFLKGWLNRTRALRTYLNVPDLP